MKKSILFLFFAIITHSMFSIPNIKLYKEGKLEYIIKDNKVYDADNYQLYTIKDGKLYYASSDSEVNTEPFSRTITEKDDSIIIEDHFEEKLFHREAYSKKNGICILSQYDSFVNEYDENTGLPIKESFYENGILDHYRTYSWKNQQLQNTIFYLADDKIDQKIEYTYDIETNKRIKEICFDGNDNMTCLIENNPQTEKIEKKFEYNQDKSLKSLTLFENEQPTEKLIYANGTKEVTKKKFISFPDDKKYILSDDYYLTSSNYTCYSTVTDCEENKQNKVIDWNKGHIASFKKYDFSNKDKVYDLIQKLKENDLLIPSSDLELHKRNSDAFFFFDVKDDEIDLSSCYKIEISKKTNKHFASMNKSGKNSGPFGFDIGMTYDEVKAACGGTELEHISDERYFVKPKKSHPLFEKYIVWISNEYGLYYIKGISRDIITSSYGTEVRNQFDKLLYTLEQKYGKFEKMDSIKNDCVLKSENFWMDTINEGAREYRANWFTLKPEDHNGLESIGLGIECSNKYSTDKAYIWLEYEFTNYDNAKEALDDVF